MLLLTAKQVNYCNVIQATENHALTLEGISYQNKLFKKLTFFPRTEKQEAIDYAKQRSLANKGRQLVLVIKEQDIVDDVFAIWQEDNTLKLKELKDYTANEIDLKELVTRMRDIGGVRIGDRQYNLTTYHNCFVGTEAVLWFIQTLNVSIDEAIRLGQRLIDEKWIHHVVDEHDFENEYLFYRFYWDE